MGSYTFLIQYAPNLARLATGGHEVHEVHKKENSKEEWFVRPLVVNLWNKWTNTTRPPLHSS